MTQGKNLGPLRVDPLLRFIKTLEFGPKILATSCWNWTGHINRAGYGHFWDGDKDIRAHRWAWARKHGPIPEGLETDHLCRNPRCVNPDHLEIVTSGENTRRGIGPTAINARKTHCIHGHEFTPDNIYHPPYSPAWRKCRTCRRAGR